MPEEIESGGATLKIDEDTGKAYWSLWGADWKDGADMEAGEDIILAPDTFPPGTRILIIEPGDPRSAEFYRTFGGQPP